MRMRRIYIWLEDAKIVVEWVIITMFIMNEVCDVNETRRCSRIGKIDKVCNIFVLAQYEVCQKKNRTKIKKMCAKSRSVVKALLTSPTSGKRISATPRYKPGRILPGLSANSSSRPSWCVPRPENESPPRHYKNLEGLSRDYPQLRRHGPIDGFHVR